MEDKFPDDTKNYDSVYHNVHGDVVPHRKDLELYNVIVYNCECHTADFVERVFEYIGCLDREEAHSKMMLVHLTGQAIVKTTPLEHAEYFEKQFTQRGLITTLQRAG